MESQLIIDDLKKLPFDELQKVIMDACNFLEEKASSAAKKSEVDEEALKPHQEQYDKLNQQFKELPRKIEFDLPVKLRCQITFGESSPASLEHYEDDYTVNYHPQIKIKVVKTPEVTRNQVWFIDNVFAWILGSVDQYFHYQETWNMLNVGDKKKFESFNKKLMAFVSRLEAEAININAFDKG